MMKSLFGIAFLLLALLLPATAVAYDLEVDGIYYSYGSEAGTVEVTESPSAGKYSGDIIIPETVTHMGTPYSVTAIQNEAFAGCSGLTSVTIPASTTAIGMEAFAGCSGLTDVYSHISDLSKVTCGSNLFYLRDKDYSGRTLHVPHGVADAYQADERWHPYFGQIVDDPTPTFTGVEPYPVIEVKPDKSTGLDKIFVVYNTDGVKMNYTATTDKGVTWERFDFSSGQLVIEEITDTTHAGNVITLNHVIPNTGYRIMDGPYAYYYWVVNYADYQLELNDLLYHNENPCDLLRINIDGHADTIYYYTVAGHRQVLDRDIKLTYSTLVWDDTYHCWQEQEIVENFAALDQSVEIVPPLCNTSFEMRGDRFLELWGEEWIVEGSYFHTQAVDCRTTAAQEDNWDGTDGELGGTAPVHIVFTGYPTDGVVNRVWEMAIDPEFQHVIQLFHRDEVDYTFNYKGTYYMRYRVSNRSGTCAAVGDTYIITISKGENIDDIPGDANHDGEVDIADVNTVVDIILGFMIGDYPAANVNGDGEINIADINAIIAIIQGAYEEHEWVDLGLTSGTLWATCNVGASSPEEFGDYFAWGETEPKEVYNEQTYKWSDGHYRLTKYCTDSQYGIVDNKTKLDREDDAAWVNWGPKWCTPSLEQFIELYEECDFQFIQKDGVTFLVFTGPNGNTLSFPAAGLRVDGSLHNAGTSGYYWQSRLGSDNDAYGMDLHSTGWGWGDCNRRRGMSVRAVRVASDDNQGLYIEQPMLELGEVPMGESVTGQLKIINDTWEDLILRADIEAPFKFTHNGHTYNRTTMFVPRNTYATLTVIFTANMTGEFDGNVTFRSPALEGGQSIIPVHVRAVSDATSQQQWVDLGLPSGTLWATMNVGAGSPEESGDHFAWGETEPKEVYNWENYKWCNGSSHTLTKYCDNSSYGTVDDKTELELEDDAAWVNMGTSWRMPSQEQMEELLDNCTLMNMTRNGVKGQLFIGSNGNTLFLPTGEEYWSRTLAGQCYAYKLSYLTERWDSSVSYRSNGYAVRAVRMSQER